MRKEWTTTEEKKLRELFSVYKTKDVAQMMGRSYRSVRDHAYTLKLKKQFDFRDLWLPGQKPKHTKKGHCSPGCEKGWFQQGNAAHKHLIGAQVVRWGCLFVKVSDHPTKEGSSRQRMLVNWKRKKNLIWEELHGPIPEGMFVTLKDGNPINCEPDNLALVSAKRMWEFAIRDKTKWQEAAKRTWAIRKNQTVMIERFSTEHL